MEDNTNTDKSATDYVEEALQALAGAWLECMGDSHRQSLIDGMMKDLVDSFDLI